MSEDLEVEKSGYFYVVTIHLGFSNLKNQVCESESSRQIVKTPSALYSSLEFLASSKRERRLEEFHCSYISYFERNEHRFSFN